MPKNPIVSAVLAVGVVVSGLVSALLLRGAMADVLATGHVFSDFQVMLLPPSWRLEVMRQLRTMHRACWSSSKRSIPD